MKRLNFKTLIRNLYNMCMYDFHESDNGLSKEQMNQFENIKDVHKMIRDLQLQIILTYFEDKEVLRKKYNEELNYIKENGLCVFPYKNTRLLGEVSAGFDAGKNIPYVMHNKKRLYFPNTYSLEDAQNCYRNFIQNENILGGNYKEKSPHQYQSDKCSINDGDILLDVGCAEALFSIDVIDKVSKVYLIENNVEWIPALKATFEPYKDKCVLINKLVSDRDGDLTITLKSILEKEENKSVFIKMDIEGYEYQVLQTCKEYLKDRKDVKCVCTTYHRNEDAENIFNYFSELGMQVEFSDGYMLFPSFGLDKLTPPYFRKGVLRAY